LTSGTEKSLAPERVRVARSLRYLERD